MHLRTCLGLLAWMCAALPAAAQLREVKSKYYTIYTDLDAEHVSGVTLRIERMAEAYHARTRGFAGQVRERMPFHFFQRPEDYYQAGGMPGSAGMFDGRRLMMIAGENPGRETWRVMQHEGFHQFVHAVIGGEFPIWVNEGMAEYFAEAEFTGDGYVMAMIPPERLRRIQKWIKEGHAISIREMMNMPHALWNAQMSLINYDQAWSMIYFLAHGDGGKYQDALNGFIRDVAKGAEWERAWESNFGGGQKAFEKKWKDYWLGLPPDPTAERRVEATLATLTSFYARAFSQRQIFKTYDEFVAAARAGQLKQPRQDKLPLAMLTEALARTDEASDWQVRKLPGRYELVCRPRSGEGLLAGTFQLASGRVKDVDVERRKK
jgi:hypothetical protein